MKGVFIVIEGTDGTGKATQTQKLVEFLRSQGKNVAVFDFPQYGQPSCYFVERYLNGAYGQLPPHTASLFYALDRFEAGSKIRQALEEGKIVVSNRYVASNMAHQGGKIGDAKKRQEYFAWNDNLEYGILGIPRPDLNIILHIPAEIAQQLVDKKDSRAYVGGQKRDLHEKDIEHLKRAEQVYIEITKLFPQKFTLISCMEGERLMTIDEIHSKIAEIVKKLL
ncbi:MAG: dTMP kinase [Candidatus Woesearchaeota archaeon]